MKNNNLYSIIFGTIFGLLAGVAGALSINLNSVGDLNSLNFNREVNLSDYGYLSPNLVIRDPKKVVVNQDVKVDETIRDIQNSLLGVFVRNDKNTSYYELSAPYAHAVAATNDGWVMALWPEATVAATLNKASSTYVVIDSQRNIYEIDRILTGSDDLDNLVFLHLNNASSLVVKRLLPEGEIKLGQSLILATDNKGYIVDSLAAKNLATYDLDSDQYLQKISLAYNQEEYPAIVFNLSGEILGLVDREGKWLLSPVIDSYWRALLRDNTLQRASLGLNYLDLSLVITNDQQLPDRGALIQTTNELAAVVKGGAADKAGLKEGDIIIRFNGVEINKDNNLSLLLLTYSPGNKVIINYLREGVSMETEAVLGAI
ncbi:MAG: PDZ domain-containing protein [Patescibacteria group bacterium]|nr:PDZ domain-containing protein [Patescibacteria group bacterium]